MDLRVNLKLDGSGFTQGLTSARQAVGRFGTNMASGIKGQLAAAFGVGTIIYATQKLTRATIAYADKWGEIAQRLGVNVEYIQAMSAAVELQGAKGEDLVRVWEKLAIAREEALKGKAGNQQEKDFAALGISGAELKQPMQILFGKIAVAFQTGSQGELIPAFQRLGGRGAGVLIPAFMDGIDEGMQAAKDRGAVMSAETVAAVGAIQDAFDAFGQMLVVQFGPAVLGVAKLVLEAGLAFRTAFAFIKPNAGALGQAMVNLATGNQYGAMAATGGGLAEGAKGARTSAEQAAEIMSRLERTMADMAAKLRNPTQPNLSGLTHEPEKAKKLPKVASPSDALISVGNFLGAGRGAIDQVHKENLVVNKEQLLVMREVNKGIQIIIRSTTGTGIEIPVG